MPKVKKPTTPDDLSSLKQRCEVLELDNAILQETIDILKKDPGADPRDLSNREKSQVIGALKMKTHYPVQNLLQRGNLSPSSCFYHQRRIQRPDPLAPVRVRIRQLFEENRCVYGYRRIWYSLRQENLRISEKVVRRLMSELSLKVKSRKAGKSPLIKASLLLRRRIISKETFMHSSPLRSGLRILPSLQRPLAKCTCLR